MNRYAALASSDDALRQRDPCATGGEVDRIETGPVLQDVVGGEGFGPGDLEGVDKLIAREVEDDPLRMERIVVTCVAAGEIGIALPVGALVSVGDAGEAECCRCRHCG